MSNERTRDDEEEVLPFDVEVERLPTWVHVSSALVVVVGALVAADLVHVLVLLPFLAASSLGRRFASAAAHVEVSAEGLDLGDRTIRPAEIADVWVDDDESERRVAVAFGPRLELRVLHFANREQARRFGDALVEVTGAERLSPVAGHLPRPVDWLSPLRFVAIAAAFFGTGSTLGVLVLAFFALGAWNIVRAKQLIARADHLELRSVLGARAIPYTEIAAVDAEDGVLRTKGGAEITVARSAVRDAALATDAWLERARARVFEHIASSTRAR